MSRRIKPCEFCEDDSQSDYIDDRNGFTMWMEVYPFHNLITVMAQANNEEGELIEHNLDVTMNYCPVCGRKLL